MNTPVKSPQDPSIQRKFENAMKDNLNNGNIYRNKKSNRIQIRGYPGSCIWGIKWNCIDGTIIKYPLKDAIRILLKILNESRIEFHTNNGKSYFNKYGVEFVRMT